MLTELRSSRHPQVQSNSPNNPYYNCIYCFYCIFTCCSLYYPSHPASFGHPSQRDTICRSLVWLQRSLGTTRTTILSELQREPMTVEQLARILAIAPSAVRTHLALLERDGIIERLTVHRASPGKPAHAYRIAESASVFLSSAYAPVALHLLEALQEKLPSHEISGMLRSAGRRSRVPPSHEQCAFARTRRRCGRRTHTARRRRADRRTAGSLRTHERGLPARRDHRRSPRRVRHSRSVRR